ncbi:MAG TPA: DUF1559 domain-containing protein [Planctomycetaceae bacterium]|nr:DUF1559 domain-containing protein [Planctomycetaceae bacterium]
MRFRLALGIIAAVLLSSNSDGQQKQKTATPVTSAVSASGVHRYMPEDVGGVAAIQPARILKSKHLQTLIDAAEAQSEMDEMLSEMTKELGLDPREIQEAAVLFDKETIDRTLNPSGAAPQSTLALTNNLKQFALAMHNMHDVYNQFPDDDGIDNENKGNLSWRVWMLPYLEQSNLYNQFHLDEPWDSDHNKTLIEKMPKIFECPGVTEKGKTSVHVFTGPGAPFAGDKAPGIQDITDGTSNTIMMVLAGADKADIWTKPGGLDFDPEDPIKALGKIDKKFLVAFMDGRVRSLSADIDPTALANTITHSDGIPVPDLDLNGGGRRARVQSMPGIILRTTVPLDRKAVFELTLVGLGEGEAGKIGLQDVTVFESCMVAMPDDRTLLVGPEPLLTKMLAPRAAAGKSTGTVHQQLTASFPINDVAWAIDLEPLTELKKQLSQNIPMPGLLESIQGVLFTADLEGTGKFLSQIEVRTTDNKAATQMSGLAQGMLQMQKAQMLMMANTPQSPISSETAEMIAELYDTVEIKTTDSTVSYVMPKPESMDALVEKLKPAFVAMFGGIREAKTAGVAMSRKNNMKQIGLAFHNYHDTYNHLPAADGNGERGQGKKTGLSWRVYLLPFVEEAVLYQQFNLDEAWDSPQNKALIGKMPDIFKVEGVDKPGYTSVHVFAGDDTAMRKEEGTGFREFTDGLSNTLLAVVAGPDTAEVWTEPGGLEFDPDNPKKALGEIGEQFLVLISDGSVRYLKSDIDNEVLQNLIQRNDGNAVDLDE